MMNDIFSVIFKHRVKILQNVQNSICFEIVFRLGEKAAAVEIARLGF